MRSACLLAAALSACSAGSGRVETISRAPAFRARAVAIAAVRGAGGSGGELARELARRLEAGGLRAVPLDESDSVLAGASVGLDAAANPRVLGEIGRATGADAVVFLTLAPRGRSLDVVVLDIGGGDAVLRATARPRRGAFATPAEAAAAAARAIMAPASGGSQAAELPVP